jgi:hypothetical protein
MNQFSAQVFLSMGRLLGQIVEVFDVDAPPPNVAYGWAMKGDQGPQYVTVKGVPPADSPLAAVRVWLVSQSKK